MLCQNCGKNEANIRYTQIINGVKKEIALCENCAKKIGLDNIGIPDMAMNLNSFLGDFFNDYAESALLPNFRNDVVKCKNCGMTYDEFIKNGMFGCSECYDTFSAPIDSLLKNLHGTAKHIGRRSKTSNKKIDINTVENENKKDDKELEKEKLQKELDKAIKEERYEDAAKIRDQIKEMK